MKKEKLIYWISTILFAGFMGMTAIPDILKQQEAVDFITKLGYPIYFIPFIGVLKLAGSIVLFIPGNFKLKEWAYAGIFFDLLGAIYSNVMVHGFDPGLLFMVPIIGLGIISYIYNDKLYLKS